jgi:hypothetical protein
MSLFRLILIPPQSTPPIIVVAPASHSTVRSSNPSKNKPITLVFID